MERGGELLLRELPRVLSGESSFETATPQAEVERRALEAAARGGASARAPLASHAARLTRDDGRIDPFSQSLQQAFDRWRSAAGWPGGWLVVRSRGGRGEAGEGELRLEEAAPLLEASAELEAARRAFSLRFASFPPARRLARGHERRPPRRLRRRRDLKGHAGEARREEGDERRGLGERARARRLAVAAAAAEAEGGGGVKERERERAKKREERQRELERERKESRRLFRPLLSLFLWFCRVELVRKSLARAETEERKMERERGRERRRRRREVEFFFFFFRFSPHLSRSLDKMERKKNEIGTSTPPERTERERAPCPSPPCDLRELMLGALAQRRGLAVPARRSARKAFASSSSPSAASASIDGGSTSSSSTAVLDPDLFSSPSSSPHEEATPSSAPAPLPSATHPSPLTLLPFDHLRGAGRRRRRLEGRRGAERRSTPRRALYFSASASSTSR